MPATFDFWAPLLVRAFMGVVALFLIRDGVHALLGRPIITGTANGPAREYSGWGARIFGAMALVFGLLLGLWAIYGLSPE